MCDPYIHTITIQTSMLSYTVNYMSNYEPRHEISNKVICATRKDSDQAAHMRSLVKAISCHLNYSMTVKLLTEHHLEFLSL